MGGYPDGRTWAAGLPAALSVQARLLSGLIDQIEPRSEWEWLVLSCSVAAGRGDELSDLDLGLGHSGDDAPPVEQVTDVLRRLGDVIDVADQPWDDCHRWWVQYADGGQIDLVVMPATTRSGRAPGEVALLDRAGRLQDTFTPSVFTASPDDPKHWLLDGWEALSNVSKYVRRNSSLEAVEQLARARQRVYQLWAVGERVPYPTFGLTSLLDESAACLPPTIEGTYARPDAAEIVDAALVLAGLLPIAAEHAQPGLGTPLSDYVTIRLRQSQSRSRSQPRFTPAGTPDPG